MVVVRVGFYKGAVKLKIAVEKEFGLKSELEMRGSEEEIKTQATKEEGPSGRKEGIQQL